MVVDYLRTAYSSLFKINREGVTVRGRYYRAAPKAAVYRDPCLYRSGIWIGEEYLDEEPGDTLRSKQYDKGIRTNTAFTDLRRTLAVSTDCDNPVLVAGNDGLPAGCGSVSFGSLWVQRGRGTIVESSDTLDRYSVPEYFPFRELQRVSLHQWELWTDDTPYPYLWRVSYADGEFVVELQTRSFYSNPGATLVASVPKLPAGGVYPATAMKAVAPWHEVEGVLPLLFTLQEFI